MSFNDIELLINDLLEQFVLLKKMLKLKSAW